MSCSARSRAGARPLGRAAWRADRPAGPAARVLAGLPTALLAVVGLALPAGVAAQEAELPVVVVLPFRVQSDQPIDYLGESVANLVRTKLAASGRVRLVDPARAARALAATELGASADADLRRAAASLGADWVVGGSLTELAGRYGLDLRIVAAAAGVPSRTRIATAQGEEELAQRTDELAAEILAHLAGETSAPVASVELEGLPGDAAELRSRLRTRAGETFDADAVEEDLAQLRADPRIATARVETERGDAGVAVRFEIEPAAPRAEQSPAPGADAGTGATIVEVRIQGNRRIETEAVQLRLGSRVGEPLRRAQVARDVRAIHELGFFRDVRAAAEPAPGGVVLVFEVEESPVVRQISLSGNENVDGDRIRDILTLTTGTTLDPPLLYENRERIAALYRAEGYYLAEVESEVESTGEASVGIHFRIEEGEKLKLRAILFTGNEFFSDADLLEGFQTRRWRLWSYLTSWFDRSGTYSEPLFLQDLRSVETKYTDAGFLQVEIAEPNVIPEEDGLTVSVPVREGRRFRVGELDVAGDATVDIEELRAKLALATGDWFDRSALTDDVASLTDHYRDRGFYFANVSPLTNLTEASEDVDVVFQVRKGPLYFVRQVDIAGNDVTVDPVIRSEIPVVEGQLYSQRQIRLAKRRVENLGFFEEVDIRPEPTEEPDQLDMHVTVVERPTGSFSFGAGFSSQDQFVVTGSLSQSNLFGRGYATNLSADVGGRTQRFFVSLNDPSFLGTEWGVGVTAFRTALRFEDFQQDQIGGDLVLGHALSEDGRTRGAVRYSFSSREIDDDDNLFEAASVILRELVADSLTSSSMSLSLSRDHRNNRLAPTAGYVVNGTAELAGLGFRSRFLRLEARGAYYLGAPRWLFENSTFVVSTRLGYALPLNTIGDFDLPPALSEITTDDGQLRPLAQIDADLELPLSERYFLGGLGAFQLRGFRGRSVGPRRAILQRSLFAGVPISADFNQYTTLGRRVVVTGLAPRLDEFGQPVPDENGDPAFDPVAWSTICDPNRDGIDEPGQCNDITDQDVDDFENLDATDVIGGNKFISSSLEYRFPISETVGLQGVVFLDTGNAFAEGENLFDVQEWRYGTGAGVQWFSPFGPLALVLGFPLDPLSIEKSPVFEFSVGGGAF